jgi:hypothetical protein
VLENLDMVVERMQQLGALGIRLRWMTLAPATPRCPI